MRKLGSLGLALFITLSTVAALGAAGAKFPCDFVEVAARHSVAGCPAAPAAVPHDAPLLSMRRTGVNGS